VNFGILDMKKFDESQLLEAFKQQNFPDAKVVSKPKV
jgi:hypothetical protein